MPKSKHSSVFRSQVEFAIPWIGRKEFFLFAFEKLEEGGMGTGEPVTAQQQCIGCSPPSPRPPVGGLKKSVGQNSLYWKEKSNFRIEGTLFGSNSPFRFLPQCQLFREASPHCLSKIAAPRTPQQSEFPLLIWDFFSFSMLHRVRPCHSAELPFEMGYP